MRIELGSEFHTEEFMKSTGVKLPSGVSEYVFNFSGRTSIEMVLKNEKRIRKAMLPSYCCESMIEPFKRMKIEVCFYEVYFDNGMQIDVQIPEDVDVLLLCNYFGFNNSVSDLTEFVDRGGIVVEDITHSFFSKKQYHLTSKYLVASLRKWGPALCGGYCAVLSGGFLHKPAYVPEDQFIKTKKKAMKSKAEYLAGKGDVSLKEDFLQEFMYCNSWLADNYTSTLIDKESLDYFLSLDYNWIYDIRRKNAQVLYNELSGIEGFHFLFQEKEMDCPLFVPIVFENGERDKIRRILIENNIYCPVHWPKPKENCNSNLYDMELSLLCDQRYNEFHMKRIVEVIRNNIGLKSQHILIERKI